MPQGLASSTRQVKRWFKRWVYSTGAMNPLGLILAPLVLMLPAAMAGDDARRSPAGDAADLGLPTGPMSRPAMSSLPAGGPFRPATAHQVRIEEHITIRISPRPAPMPMMPSMFSQDFDPPAGMPRYVERKVGKCVAVQGIAGVQPGAGNRLLLIMRDQRVISAALGKSCQSRDYYSGFLVARNSDGMICQGRDQLLARNGANCQVSGFRQLVEIGD